ncbi:hypothetical protein [Aquicella lusitana]|uniref:Flagellar protein FliT n=1 Tax=Aquicella lusitana TaxID=254246 RepID=A0A370GDB3_9COXI|nr:hypothetical protein [Aquicella lusitana]RDI39953.1 hypothetical protein C8D86_12514 [Aquicella lusitana]VVC74556.1 hypothetical protein AQULUS_23220 [Aquicella lusitana]
MTDINQNFEILCNEIDLVTLEIVRKLEQEELNDVDSLIARRLKMLADIMIAAGNRDELKIYLVKQRQHNDLITKIINDKQEEIRKVIRNINHVSTYLHNALDANR